MRLAFVIAGLYCMLSARAQLYDAQWALGYDESVLDFRMNDTVGVYSIPTVEYFTYTNANICDSVGNLLYYTNGISISSTSAILQNGSGLNPCPYTNEYSSIGLNIPQGALFIPRPSDSRYYYLFHFSNDTLNGGRPGTMYYTVIDEEANSGQGAVIAKNIPILQGVVLKEGGMTACKHANGRDYWLIMEASDINLYYEFLITPDSILGPYTQSIGPAVPDTGDVTYSKFSLDGSKFATGFYAGPVILMDFDRCSGVFSNEISIFNNVSTDPNNPITGCSSLEFSPNGEFLYVAGVLTMNQYDLWSTNIQDSSEIYRADSSDQYWLDMIQLAPNGKIYGSTWNGGLKAFHIVNYPDLKGDSAYFVYGGQPTLTINSNNVPNLINYNLGPLVGSGCDTLNTGFMAQRISSSLRALPNPADKYAYVEMGMQGNYEFDLLNTSGQTLAIKQTPQLDIFDTEQLAGGVYFIRVIDRTTGAEIAAKKVVVVH